MRPFQLKLNLKNTQQDSYTTKQLHIKSPREEPPCSVDGNER